MDVGIKHHSNLNPKQNNMANQKTAVEWLITMLDNAGYLKQKPETSNVSGQGVLRIVN